MQDTAHKHHKNNRVDRAAFLLKACSSLSQLKQIHAYIFRAYLHRNNSLTSSLVSLYASLSFPRCAHVVFSSVSHPNLSLFNHAIRAFSKIPSFCIQSIYLYHRMVSNLIKPDNFTYPFLLNSCAALSAIDQGIEIHGRVIKTGYCSYIPVSNALIDMYGKCNELDRSYTMFDGMPERDVVTYNALLGAHARIGQDMYSAQNLFDEMPVRNVISWNAMIVGYVNGGDLASARMIFDKMPGRNVTSWTTMLLGYTKKGFMDLAKALFDSMPQRSLVCWTAMITGYAQHGRPSEAIGLFRIMEKTQMKPDAVTMTSVISASAQLGGTELADWIGSYINQEGIERNEQVLTALVDMYAKCGNLDESYRLFWEIPRPDVIAYSALIMGLASHGQAMEALNIFHKMQMERIEPDNITFVGLLTACSHTGRIEDGLRFWESMVKDYKIEPDAGLYSCMVDMLGRAGKLDEAHKLVNSMPMGPCPGALGALLAACRRYGNVEIAEAVAELLFELEPENTGNYVLLSSIYASMGQWHEAARVRRSMKERGINKHPGSSWVETHHRGHVL